MCLKNLPNENLRTFSTIVSILVIFPNIVSFKKESLRGNSFRY